MNWFRESGGYFLSDKLERYKINGACPLVSVIIPTANRNDMLDIAIRSALAQTYPNIEVIVVDDCSQKSLVLDNYHCQQVKVIRNEKSFGGAKSRNIGARAAAGDFVCFLDDDDWYFPEKIERLVRAFAMTPEADAVFGKILRGSGAYAEARFPDGRLTDIRKVGMLHTNSSLVRRSAFEKIFFCEDLEKFQDTQFHIELISFSNVVCIPEFVAFWRDAYEGERITSMTSEAHISKSVDSYKRLVSYFSNKDLKKNDHGWLWRGYVRHLAKYGRVSKEISVSLTCYYWIVRLLYILTGKAK